MNRNPLLRVSFAFGEIGGLLMVMAGNPVGLIPLAICLLLHFWISLPD